jgi:hypothetical protein
MNDDNLLLVLIVLACADAFLVFSIVVACCYCRIQRQKSWIQYQQFQSKSSFGSGRVTAVSRQTNSCDWMQAHLPQWGVRTLRQLCIPGSHDSGMSQVGWHTNLAHAHNVQTQIHNVQKQLELGVRFFDLRPIFRNDEFYTGHYFQWFGQRLQERTGNARFAWPPATQGADGQSMDDVIKNVNDFTALHKELIILKFSHSLNAHRWRMRFLPFTSDDWSRLMTEKLAKLNYRYKNLAVRDFTTMRLNEFIRPGQAAVLVLIDGDAPTDPRWTVENGFYPCTFGSDSVFPLFDKYSNTSKYDAMKEDQLSKMKNNRPNPDATCFLLSWTLTQNTNQATFGRERSILDLAKVANSRMSDALAACSPTVFPNVFYIDGIDESTKLIETVLEINATANTNSRYVFH